MNEQELNRRIEKTLTYLAQARNYGMEYLAESFEEDLEILRSGLDIDPDMWEMS